MHRKNRFIAVSLLSILFLFSSCSSKTASVSVPQSTPAPADNTQTNITSNNDANSKADSNQSDDKTTTAPTTKSNSNENSSSGSTSEEKNKPETKPSQDTKSASPDNIKRSWYYKPNSTHTTPEVPAAIKDMLKNYSGYYVGDTNSKDIYLTFDEGYENGYSSKILDILKANNVKAAFFVTRPYILQQKDLIKRMVSEGHVVGNHTSKHLSMPTLTSNADAFKKEFTDTEEAFKSVTGTDMPKFFRPPMGEYSAKSLMMTKELGYKSIFWSFAHRDWLVDNQPGATASHDRVIKGAHNGAIVLLHAVSKSNTEALDSILKDLKSQGYVFKTLYELK